MNQYFCFTKDQLYMELGDCIKKIREAKGLSQKEVALSCKMDMGNYSRIENGKTDPSFNTVVKIAKALGVELYELFNVNSVYKDISTYDKTLIDKLTLIEELDKKEKQAFFVMLDALVNKKRLKDTLNNALSLTQ
jgi:transcriptional regulator with XRE-family HTH domain